jgi:pSer/pThr/pTyr-binding forkhead associated (FHA) protein
MQDGINRRELTFKSLAGLAGGAAGWLPVEITSHGHSLTEIQTTGQIIAGFVSMALLSGLIGGAINASESQSLELTPALKRRFLIGFVLCLLLSLPANYYSNVAFSYVLAAGGWGVDHAGSTFFLVLARLIGWSMMGAMLGAGVGLATFSPANIAKGAIGGLIGGFVGGIVFDAMSASMGGLMSRLFGFSAIGLCIGLFIGLVQELTKAAWLKVEAGRLRGREYRIEKAIANLGRAEENEVGLFGDPGVGARHARIERHGGKFLVKDLSIREGTILNGERIESAELHDGDRLRLGDYELSFHVRKTPGLFGALPIGASPAPPAPWFAASTTASAVAAPCLVDASGRSFSVRQGTTTNLGRALDNDVVLDHQSVSRHHASIVALNGGFRLRDLSSQNGTWVGGQKIGEAELADGDMIKLGDAEFTFRR